MNLLARLKTVVAGDRAEAFDVPASEASARAATLLTQHMEERQKDSRFAWTKKPTDYSSGRAILEAEPAVQIAVIHELLARSARLFDSTVRSHEDDIAGSYYLVPLLNPLLRRRQPYTDQDIHHLLVQVTSSRAAWYGSVPLQAVLRSIERYFAGQELSSQIRADLQRLRASGAKFLDYAYARKAKAFIDEMLGEGRAVESVKISTEDDWGYSAQELLSEMGPADQDAWLKLLAYANTANAPRPSARWIAQAGKYVKELGEERFRAGAIAWLDLLGRPPLKTLRVNKKGNVAPPAIIAEQNATLLRGLIWCCSLFDDPEVARALGDAGESCFRKIPEWGVRSGKAGNACIYSLGTMQGIHGVTQLQRLQQRVKYASAQSLIDYALTEAAQRIGLSRQDLDDLSVTTFGLQDGRIEQQVGDYTAQITIVPGPRAELRWLKPDGTPYQSEPAGVKRQFPDEVKALKRAARDIQTALLTQRGRLERLFVTGRSWSLPEWRERYLDHPLLSSMTRRLIWRFEEGERQQAAIWWDGEIVDAEDGRLDWLTDETRVSLWHPIGVGPDMVLAWRLWLERHEVSQPFKQAHREVYILTDAELNTATYSNRFAAHILRQHQFHALCQQRGWIYRLQGNFDGHNTPTIELPQWGLKVEFWVEGGNDDTAISDFGISLYVSTDQVRFYRLGEDAPLPLAEVPALAFSELMRDVDLFVGVCSVGNDPNWVDSGPERYRDYWHDYSFGDLSASAQTRRAVLERLIPRLKIAPRCSLADKFLVVRGDLRTYKIHLGSGNILMEPNNQYLCIVPSRGVSSEREAGKVFLPFEGDTVLSLILSKAFLLAEDREISDPTITRQIGASSPML